MKHPPFPVDLHSVARHIVTQITDGGNTPPSVVEVARSFDPSVPPDLVRVMKIEKIDNEQEAKEWMVSYAASQMPSAVVEEDGLLRFAPGKDISNSHYDGKVLKPLRKEEKQPWSDAFNPMKDAGVFAANVRGDYGKTTKEDVELRESMERFGWLPFHPAVKDEFGVVLVGHRRLRVAADLGIEPQIEVYRVGTGTEGDALRFRLAIGSNLGGKPFTEGDRKRIAMVLYEEHGWTLARIAEALDVSKATVSGDLADVPKKGKGTKKSGVDDPAWQALADPLIRRWASGEITRDEAAAEAKQAGLVPNSYARLRERRFVLEALDQAKTPADVCSTTEQTYTPSTSAQTTPEEPPKPKLVSVTEPCAACDGTGTITRMVESA